jgi:hypothetical protein
MWTTLQGLSVIFAARWTLAKGSFRVLVRPSQRVVQERPEIGFDDVDFTPHYRDLSRKIVDNIWADPRDPITTNRPRQLESPTTLSARTIVYTPSALNLSLPAWAGAVLTRPDARIDPGPGSRRRTGFPPHLHSPRFRDVLARAHRLTRAIDTLYKADGSPSQGGQKTGVVS